MTLDKLAGMMARSFDEIDSRMNQGFDAVNDRMDQGFAGVNKRLEKVEDRLEQVEFHIFELKTKESVIDKEIGMLKRRTDNMERRIMAK